MENGAKEVKNVVVHIWGMDLNVVLFEFAVVQNSGGNCKQWRKCWKCKRDVKTARQKLMLVI